MVRILLLHAAADQNLLGHHDSYKGRIRILQNVKSVKSGRNADEL